MTFPGRRCTTTAPATGFTGDDYRAVIDLMARQHYNTTGWVDTVPLSGVIEQGFEPLRAGRKMKLLVDPAAYVSQKRTLDEPGEPIRLDICGGTVAAFAA